MNDAIRNWAMAILPSRAESLPPSPAAAMGFRSSEPAVNRQASPSAWRFTREPATDSRSTRVRGSGGSGVGAAERQGGPREEELSLRLPAWLPTRRVRDLRVTGEPRGQADCAPVASRLSRHIFICSML